MIKLFFCISAFFAASFAAHRSAGAVSAAVGKLFRDAAAGKRGISAEYFAGSFGDMPPEKKKFFLGAACAFSGLVLALAFTSSLILSAVISAACWFIPGFAEKNSQEKQLALFNTQLIDALAVISNSLRAGASLSQGIETASRETKPPVSREFAKASQEMKLGIPLPRAMENMASRVKSSDLRMFATTINIARETGGNLPEILGIIADTMRERNKVRGKIAALTAQGRMSGYVVGSMPFLLMFMLYIMAPELLEPMFTTTLGQFMLACVVVLVITGGVLIRKIVDIDI